MNGRYELPEALLAVRLSIFGRSGYGKTNVAKRATERLLAGKRRVGIIDPTDSWYGLRKKPDGKRDAFKVIIFGGEFGDLPLNEHAGGTIGRALAQAKESWIVSLAEMPGEGARKRFMADLLSALYDHNRAPLHLIVDEADTIAPQRQNSPAESICVARMEQIVKRGRKRGFVPWLITQRPADVATSVRSQTDALVSLSLTLPHDIKAVRSWVAEHDEDGTAAALFKEITKLPKGEGIVWWPGHDVLARASFAKTKTYDSGKTPEPGDVRVKLKPLKVDSLAKAVADLIKEREENAPDKLRARIAELERELELGSADAGEVATLQSEVERLRQQVKTVAVLARMLGKSEGYGQALGDFDGQSVAIEDAAGKLADKVDAMIKTGDSLQQAYQRMRDNADGPTYAEVMADYHDAVPGPSKRTPAPPQRHGAGGKAAARVQESKRPAKSASVNGTGQDDGRLRPGERRILTALAQVPSNTLEAGRVAARVGMPKNGGTFKTYAARLKKLGMIEAAGRDLLLTALGREAVGQVEPLPMGRALREHWKQQLRPGEIKIMEAVASGLHDAADIGSVCAMPPTGGTFKTYMARLKKLGIVSGDGREGFKLHEDLR